MLNLSEQEREDLAKHLASMKYQKARNEIRKLDPDAKLKYWRNAIRRNEWHTVYILPNMGLKVTLIEEPDKRPIGDSGKQKVNPVFIEVRVEVLNP